MKKYLLLIDYGCDGWAIQSYESKEDLLKDITNGDTYGNPFKVAEEMDMYIDVIKEVKL